MKYMFLVQGEGRGHMTQAIVLSKILTSNGHEIAHTFIGESNRRNIPAYVHTKIDSVIETIPSPNFVLDKKNRGLKLGKSILYNAQFLGTWRKSLKTIHQKVEQTKPDAIINFNEFLGGLYFTFYNPGKVKHICIGRQFLSQHPNYPFEAGRKAEKFLYLLNNYFTSLKCDKFLALSFRAYYPINYKNSVVVPPLLKDEVKRSNISCGDFLVAYMVNDGYAEELIHWHTDHQDIKIHCFWDRKNMPATYTVHKNLTFHQLNDVLFHDMLSQCKAYISTAGFESICEAMYLQKPVFMIPVEGQYEQACNAIDGEIAGAGKRGNSFDISKFIEYIPGHMANSGFHKWIAYTESIFLKELTNL